LCVLCIHRFGGRDRQSASEQTGRSPQFSELGRFCASPNLEIIETCDSLCCRAGFTGRPTSAPFSLSEFS
jgi:hypothetical protein